MSVCLSVVSTSIHLIDFTLGGIGVLLKTQVPCPVQALELYGTY